MGNVAVDRRGEAVWITLDAPERRNAFDPEMTAAAVAAIEASTDVRAVVITGAPGAFCAGGALNLLGTATMAECAPCTGRRCGSSTRCGSARGRSSRR